MNFVTALFGVWLVKFGEHPIDAKHEVKALVRLLKSMKLPTDAEVYWEKVINDENSGMPKHELLMKHDPGYRALNEDLAACADDKKAEIEWYIQDTKSAL